MLAVLDAILYHRQKMPPWSGNRWLPTVEAPSHCYC